MHLSAQTGRKRAEQSSQMTLAIDIRHCRRGGEQLQAKAAYRVPDKGWNRFLSMAQTQNSHQAAHRTTSGKCHKGRPTGRERRPLPPPPAKGPAKRPISQCQTADIAMQNGRYCNAKRPVSEARTGLIAHGAVAHLPEGAQGLHPPHTANSLSREPQRQ